VAQKQAIWSRFSARSIGFGAIHAVTLICSASGAFAGSDDPFKVQNYQAGLRITIPFAGDKMKSEEATFALTAGPNQKKAFKTDDYAYLSFTGDGYIKKAKIGHLSMSMPLPIAKTTQRQPQNLTRLAAATHRPHQRRTMQSYQNHCAFIKAPTNARQRPSKKLELRTSYCFVLQKHNNMIAAYQRYKQHYSSRRQSVKNAMPELAGGPKVRMQTTKSKHAYYDYLVSQKAYQQALGNYNALLRPVRKRSRRGWR